MVGKGLHAVYVLNGPAHPKSFKSQLQTTALYIQFTFLENALKLTYSNVETTNLSGVIPRDPRERGKGRGRAGEGEGEEEGNWSPTFQTLIQGVSTSCLLHALIAHHSSIHLLEYTMTRYHAVKRTNEIRSEVGSASN